MNLQTNYDLSIVGQKMGYWDLLSELVETVLGLSWKKDAQQLSQLN